jgi:hypothetical protein
MRQTTVAAGLAVLSLAITGCGADQNTEIPMEAGVVTTPPNRSAQPPDTFDDIPRPSGTAEVGARTEENGAITQSFAVTATPPGQVMDFFTGALADQGWTPVTPVEPRGSDTLFGAWEREGQRLEVTAGPAPGIPDDTQYNLVLLASLEPGRDVNTVP